MAFKFYEQINKQELPSMEVDNVQAFLKDFSVSEDSTERVTLTITIPENVDEGTYDVEIYVKGRDEDNNNLHEETWTLELEIEKKTRDIKITSIELFPEVITCQNSLEVTVRIANIGERDTNEAMLKVSSNDLDDEIPF